jgi:ribosomal protein L40E
VTLQIQRVGDKVPCVKCGTRIGTRLRGAFYFNDSRNGDPTSVEGVGIVRINCRYCHYTNLIELTDSERPA